MLGGSVSGAWAPLVRSGSRSLLTAAAYLAVAVVLLSERKDGRSFGPRVLGLAFVGNAGEEALWDPERYRAGGPGDTAG